MILHFSIPTIASTVLLISQIAYAAPANSYPLAIQYPPIIQYGQPYSYQLPTDTFTSSISAVEYSVDGLPDWLSFDSSSRTISGTAPETYNDGKGDNLLWFELIGTDTTGETPVNSSLLLTDVGVESQYSPGSFQTLVESSVPFQDSDSIVLTALQSFKIKIPTTLFTSDSDSNPISYYTALTQSHSPLPIWINFNSETLEFTGTAPAVNSEIAPGQVFALSLLPVQKYGFSSSAANFDLVLGAHPFYTNISSVTETVTPGTFFSYDIPFDEFVLDGEELTQAKTSSISLNVTDDSWLSSNATSVFGTVPKDFNDTDYLVKVENIFKDIVSFSLTLHSLINETELETTQDIFNTSSTKLDVNATIGEYFQFTLPDSLINNHNADISASINPTLPWITFHQQNNTFNGFVPDSFSGATVTLTGEDKSNSDPVKETFQFSLNAVQSKSTIVSTSSSSPSPTTTDATAMSTGGDSQEGQTGKAEKNGGGISHKKLVAILCGVLIPIGVLSILAIILLCCLRKRKETERAASPRKTISPPIMIENDDTDDSGKFLSEKKSGGVSGGDTADSSSDTVAATGFILPPRQTSSPLQIPSHRNSLDTIETPPNSLSAKKSWGTPTLAAEYNLYKLDNPKTAYSSPGGATILQDESSRMSNSYSEGNSSETTHVADDGRGPLTGSNDRFMIDTRNILRELENSNGFFTTDAEQQHQHNNEILENTTTDHRSYYTRNAPIFTATTASTAIGSTVAVGAAAAAAAVLGTNNHNNKNKDGESSLNKNLDNDDEELANPPGVARNSWRQTYEPSNIWHSRKQGGSLATISTDELYSVRLVNGANKQPQTQPPMPHSQSSDSVSSSISSSSQKLSQNTDNNHSSPILQRLGSVSSGSDYRDSHYGGHGHSASNTTSIGSYSSSDIEQPYQQYQYHLQQQQQQQQQQSEQQDQQQPYSPQQSYHSHHSYGHSAQFSVTSNLGTVPESPKLATPVAGPVDDSSDFQRNNFSLAPITDTPNVKYSNTGESSRNGVNTNYQHHQNNHTLTSLESDNLTDTYDQYRTASSGGSFYENEEEGSDLESGSGDEGVGDILEVNQGRWTVTPRKSTQHSDNNIVYGQAIDNDNHNNYGISSSGNNNNNNNHKNYYTRGHYTKESQHTAAIESDDENDGDDTNELCRVVSTETATAGDEKRRQAELEEEKRRQKMRNEAAAEAALNYGGIKLVHNDLSF